MKAKEYFEKYFGGIAVLSPDTLDLIRERGDKCFSELADEIIPLYKKRGSTVQAMDGVIKELNQKYNVVSNLMEEKYGVSIFKRNGLRNCFKAMLDKYVKPLENPEVPTSNSEGAANEEPMLQSRDEN